MKIKSIALGSVVLAFSANIYAASITSTFASNNWAAGNMFNLTNISNKKVMLTGQFEGNFSTGHSGNIDVWYRLGSYVGNETSPLGWTLLGNTSFFSNGTNTATSFNINHSLILDPGQLIGLYIASSTSIRYTNGNQTISDGTLQLDLGIGRGAGTFSGEVYSPRQWNGSIYYDDVVVKASPPVGSVPIPAAIWLFGSGFIGLMGLARTKKHTA